jgi:hypothetical protein
MKCSRPVGRRFFHEKRTGPDYFLKKMSHPRPHYYFIVAADIYVDIDRACQNLNWTNDSNMATIAELIPEDKAKIGRMVEELLSLRTQLSAEKKGRRVAEEQVRGVCTDYRQFV